MKERLKYFDNKDESEVTIHKIIQRTLFMLNQEPAFAEPLGNSLERLFSQGTYQFYKHFAATIFARFILFCPWVSEDGINL